MNRALLDTDMLSEILEAAGFDRRSTREEVRS
jgi:hypothetical protein